MKLKEFKATQTTVASLLEEQSIAELVTTTKESVEHITQELEALMTRYTKVNT